MADSDKPIILCRIIAESICVYIVNLSSLHVSNTLVCVLFFLKAQSPEEMGKGQCRATHGTRMAFAFQKDFVCSVEMGSDVALVRPSF